MNFPRLTKIVLVYGLVAQMVLAVNFSTMAQAKMLSTESVIAKYSANANREYLLGEVRKQEIREKLIGLGVNPTEAEARLEALSNEEVASIIAQMDADSAGAGGGSIIGALLTVFLILLVTDLLCLTKVFKFTRCATR